MPAIVTTGITKSFGAGETRTSVLRGVDFEAEAGEMTFLVGPSGCGKTTFISILSALLSADGGALSVFGTEPNRLKSGDLVRFRRDMVGFVFQQFNLLPALDAAENVAVPLIIQGVSPRKARQRACAWLELLGLGAHLGKLPSELSGGQQQRVAIARALIHEPRLLVCDEPTASLDAETGRQVIELLREVSLNPERAAIIVTHDDRIYPYADRIAFMADGRLTHVERPDPARIPARPIRGETQP
ncbi:MAG: ABC transporter ATP-binding protein [Methylobacterium sp.]|nr:MAG: ABC transporter ATP-binding protein [Methylobacterium sp.]